MIAFLFIIPGNTSDDGAVRNPSEVSSRQALALATDPLSTILPLSKDQERCAYIKMRMDQRSPDPTEEEIIYFQVR